MNSNLKVTLLITAAAAAMACEGTTAAGADQGVSAGGESGGGAGGEAGGAIAGGSVVGGGGGAGGEIVGGAGGDIVGGAGGAGGGMGGAAVEEPPPPHSEPGTSWTILVYMVADTNLEYDALDDLVEMASVGSTDTFNIIVQADRAAGYTADPVLNLDDWEQSLRLRVETGSLTVVEDQGEVNMGDPQTLTDFITWGMTMYPADQYGLVFWDHGGGWVGFGDDESHDHDGLTLNEIKRGIDDGLAAMEVPRLNFVGFDACLMATWETAVTLEYNAEYLLASEELEPGHGWDYGALQLGHDTPSTGADALGNAIIEGFIGQATQKGTLATVTLSLTDLTQVHQVTAAINGFVGAAMPVLETLLNTIGRERAQVEEYGPMVDPNAITGMIDLVDFIVRVAEADPTLDAARGPLEAAISAAVLTSSNGVAHAKSHGLSIFFPQFLEYYSPGYDNIDRIDAWRDFIKAFHNGGANVPEGAVPSFIDEGHVPTAELIDEELVISGHLSADSAANVSSSKLFYGLADEAGTYIFGDNFALADAPTGLVTGSWDLSGFYIQQGEAQAFCYLSLEDRGDSLFATIPFVYEAVGGEQALAVLAFAVDAESGEILSLTYYAQVGDSWAELNPEEGSLLYPLIQTPGDGGLEFVRTSEVGFDIEQSTFDFSFFEAGQGIVAGLQALNFAGQGDLILYQDTL